MNGGQIALDSAWSRLLPADRATLAEGVGLPLALAAADALDLPDGAPLAAILAADAR